MRLRRLFRMGMAELACRSRQEASKWLDRAGALRRSDGGLPGLFTALASDPTLAPIRARAGRGDLRGAGGLLWERFQEAAPRRFFEGAASGPPPRPVTPTLGGARGDVIAAAEAVCRKRFDLLGYGALSFGDPMDWHLDPVSGRRAPLVHWTRLDPLDRAGVGDSKVVWELNRHQWLVSLAQAYRWTGDEGYAERFAACVREWIQANPRGWGINWASSLEVSLRLISWCWALVLFRGSGALSSGLFIRMLAGISAHATHVARYLSRYFSPNTHLTGEALGLFYAGVLFPELGPARRWRGLGLRILLEQIERQVLPDGVYFEQSTCYQRYTVEIYLHFLILAARNRVAVPAAIGERVQRMLDFLLAVRRPDGSMPQIGDADGGRLLPLARRTPEDFGDLFSTAAALFGRAEYAWAAGGPAPETFWLLGPAGLEAIEALRSVPPASPPSRLFPDGGYAVMRSGWEPDAHQLVFDVGPLGCPVSSGHGHADLLSLQCAVFGRPHLVDAGTYCYTAEPAWRDYFRSTAAHSTVMVDGRGQAVPAGPFRWQSRPRTRLRAWRSTAAFDLADADHDAYRQLPDPVVHRRRVLFVKPRYWIVVDDFEGTAEHQVELRFQFAPLQLSVDPTLWARAQGPDGRGLLLRPFATVALKAEVRDGEVAPMQGWVSPDYGQRRPAPVLVYTAVAPLPLRLLTLLYPTETPGGPQPAVAPLLDEAGTAVGLVFERSGETLRLDALPSEGEAQP